MAQKKSYYVNLLGGCTIVTAPSKEEAQKKALSIFGTIRNPSVVREATSQDLKDNASLNGMVH